MVGISWDDSQPAQGKSCDPFNDFDDPQDHDKKSGDGNRIVDPVPDNLEVQMTSFTEKFQKYFEQKPLELHQRSSEKFWYNFAI